jgi:hypothetical protein
LYKQVLAQPDLAQRWSEIKTSWQQPMLWVVLLLMFLNYGIESRKWQFLLSPLQKLSLFRAFKSVMAGCSITMLTPNRIGEYGGRILFIEPPHRLQAISLTILGSISQLAVTIVMGTCGLLYLKYFSERGASLYEGMPIILGNTLLVMSALISIFMLLFYLKLGWVIHLMEKAKFLTKPLKYVRLLEQFTGKQLLRILFLSFLRYMVFILQYMLLLKLMNVAVPIVLCFWLLSVFYLVMAMAPTIGFTELPLRATATVEIFKLYSGNLLGIQAAALGIWMTNLVLPAIIGSLLIAGIKITKDHDKNP